MRIAVPMRWGPEATRYVVQIKNAGRYRAHQSYAGYSSPDWWQGIADWYAKQSQKKKRKARRRGLAHIA